jgi:hypothetical protein
MEPSFRNVDMEIDSEESLDPIAREFGDNVNLLYHGHYQDTFNRLALEIYSIREHNPDSIINSFCDLIEKLSPKAKAIWRRCLSRRFDIGIQSGTVTKKHFTPLVLDLSSKTLKRVSVLSVEVVFTIYPITVSKEMKQKKRK